MHHQTGPDAHQDIGAQACGFAVGLPLKADGPAHQGGQG